MPQQPTALLANATPSANGGFKTIVSGGEGEVGDTPGATFDHALRQSQSALQEGVAGEGDSSGEETPVLGKDLPLDPVLEEMQRLELPLDNPEGTGPEFTGAPALSAAEDFPADSIAAKLISGDEETQEAIDIPLVSSEPPASMVVPTAPAALRMENVRGIERAESQVRMIDVALDARPADSLPAQRPALATDDGEKLLREQLPVMREVALENNRGSQSFSEELNARVTTEAARQFVNVSALTGNESNQPAAVTNAVSTNIQLPGEKGALTTPLVMETPLQAREWKEDFGERVRWLITQKMHSAELKINPPQLGAIDIKISVQNDQVSIQFQAAHAMVKDTLEDSLPRLREILSSSGLDLVDVDVAQHSGSEGRGADNDAEDRAGSEIQNAVLGETAENEMAIETDVILKQGMVDMYA